MKWICTFVRIVVFSGSIDWYFSVFVCNVVSSWLLKREKNHIFRNVFPFLLSPRSLPAPDICTNDDFKNGDDEFLILTCELVKRHVRRRRNTNDFLKVFCRKRQAPDWLYSLINSSRKELFTLDFPDSRLVPFTPVFVNFFSLSCKS